MGELKFWITLIVIFILSTADFCDGRVTRGVAIRNQATTPKSLSTTIQTTVKPTTKAFLNISNGISLTSTPKISTTPKSTVGTTTIFSTPVSTIASTSKDPNETSTTLIPIPSTTKKKPSSRSSTLSTSAPDSTSSSTSSSIPSTLSTSNNSVSSTLKPPNTQTSILPSSTPAKTTSTTTTSTTTSSSTSTSSSSTTSTTATDLPPPRPWPRPYPDPEPFNPQPYFRPPPPQEKKKKEEGNKGLLIGLAIGIPIGAIILCLLLCLGIFCYRKKKNASQKAARTSAKKNDIPMDPPPIIQVQPQNIQSIQSNPENPLPRSRLPPRPPPPVSPATAAAVKTPPLEKYTPKASAPIIPKPKPKTKNKYQEESDYNSIGSGKTTGAADPTQNNSDDGKEENSNNNELRPDRIPGEAFKHKGPLVLKKYQSLQLHHELDNDSERKVLSNEHVTFDGENVVHDIGEDVEVLISNRSKASHREPFTKTDFQTDETGSSKKDLS